MATLLEKIDAIDKKVNKSINLLAQKERGLASQSILELGENGFQVRNISRTLSYANHTYLLEPVQNLFNINDRNASMTI